MSTQKAAVAPLANQESVISAAPEAVTANVDTIPIDAIVFGWPAIAKELNLSIHTARDFVMKHNVVRVRRVRDQALGIPLKTLCELALVAAAERDAPRVRTTLTNITSYVRESNAAQAVDVLAYTSTANASELHGEADNDTTSVEYLAHVYATCVRTTKAAQTALQKAKELCIVQADRVLQSKQAEDRIFAQLVKARDLAAK